MPRIHEWRSRRDLSSPQTIRLDQKTMIIGDNGSGKTHILESIHLVSGGVMAYATEAIGGDFSVELLHGMEGMTRSYQLQISDRSRSYCIQDQKLTIPRYREELPFRTVLFSPFDMNLLFFAPSYRRDMIDGILSRAFAQFSEARRRYETALRQRNAVLKQIRNGETTPADLDLWNPPFLDSIETYRSYRLRWIRFIDHHLDFLRSFLPRYTLRFSYESRLFIPDLSEAVDLHGLIDERRSREIAVGHSLIGPHLDDFGFVVEYHGTEHPAHLFLSRGENKVLLLALKYLEIQFLQETTGREIILLFDDLFAELDPSYSREILTRFADHQMICTAQVLPYHFDLPSDFLVHTLGREEERGGERVKG